MEDKKYIIITDANIKLSQIKDDCPGKLCVPTIKGESLISILNKICNKAKDGKDGKDGKNGESGESEKQRFTAGTIINGGKAVFVDTDGLLYPFDITNPLHYGKCLGVAEQSVVLGDICSVVTSGKSNLIGSGWISGVAYYIDSTGFLTTTPPIAGWLQQVAVGIDTEIISVGILDGIQLI